MKHELVCAVSGVVSYIIGMMIGINVTEYLQLRERRAELVQYGIAEYDRTSGEWRIKAEYTKGAKQQ